MGCGNVRERLETLIDRVGASDEVAAEDVGDATGELPAAATETAPEREPAPVIASAPAVEPGPPPTPARPDELELRDVEIEWVERSGWGYYGMPAATKTLRVEGTGKLRAAMGQGGTITVKAVCDSDPAPIADADVAAIKGG